MIKIVPSVAILFGAVLLLATVAHVLIYIGVLQWRDNVPGDVLNLLSSIGYGLAIALYAFSICWINRLRRRGTKSSEALFQVYEWKED